MKRLSQSALGLSLVLLLLLPAALFAQPEKTSPGPPPIGQQLVREGDLALRLVTALAIGTTDDEIEAETMLGNVGITPRNGWIADYPVTPDIIGELQKTVRDAAASGKISMGAEEAVKQLNSMNNELGLAVKPAASGTPDKAKSSKQDTYPDQTVIDSYYDTEGPPVVTYYTPPPDYYYLYSWVGYPFWWFGFWYPGYFILNDFHRVVFVNHRPFFISNHFNDVRSHRIYRVDPVARFRGRTFAGIGASRSRGFISTGVPRSERRIFNGSGTRMSPGFRSLSPSTRGGGGYRR